MAVNVWLYGDSFRPAGRVVVLITSGGGLRMVIERTAGVTVAGILLSVTCAVNVDITPPDVGIPDMTPAVETVSPAGRVVVAFITDQVYGPIPPVAVSVRLYGASFRPVGSVLGVLITSGAGLLMVIERDALVTVGGILLSVTLAVNVVVKPPAVGVPDMTPVAGFNVRPAGRGVVAFIDQV